MLLFPIDVLLNGEEMSGPQAMLVSFIVVFLLGVLFVKKCFLKPGNVAITSSQIRQARRQAMNLTYESSDGYSGSEMEFDGQSTSNYEHSGDLSISYDSDNELPAYH